MKTLRVFIILLAVFVLFSQQSKAEEDSCLGDTEVSIKDVKKALAPILGNAKIVSVTTAPVEGLYEVVVELNGRKLPIYVDCNLRYLISGEIIDIKEKKSLTREKIAKLNQQALKEKIAELEKRLGKEKVEKIKKAFGEKFLSRLKVVSLDKLPQKGRVIFGNPNAPITVYVITDPQCPFCARLHKEIEKVLAKRKDVKFEMIFFPLPFHSQAKPVATAILCEKNNEARKRKLVQAFKSQSNIEKFKELADKSCSEAKEILSENLEFAKSIGVRGTPTLIFPHGVAISGAIPAQVIEKLIDVLK